MKDIAKFTIEQRLLVLERAVKEIAERLEVQDMDITLKEACQAFERGDSRLVEEYFRRENERS